MTRLNYSNLPPEAQEAIQKLTGCSAEELEGKQLKQTDTHTIKIGKTKPQSFKSWLLQIAVPLATLLIIGGIVFLIATVATGC